MSQSEAQGLICVQGQMLKANSAILSFSVGGRLQGQVTIRSPEDQGGTGTWGELLLAAS